jgi:hypothetical protein
VKLYHMRDNHTFQPLPLDVEGALTVIREEFAQGWSYGMLCADGGPPKPGPLSTDPNAHGHGSIEEFEPRARAWLERAIGYRSDADLEYASWNSSGIGGVHTPGENNE